MFWCCFQATVMTDRVGDLWDSTNSTHQRAQDLLSFIVNMTMGLNGMTAENQSDVYQNRFVQHDTSYSFKSISAPVANYYDERLE